MVLISQTGFAVLIAFIAVSSYENSGSKSIFEPLSLDDAISIPTVVPAAVNAT
jgi:hypothetical protein